MDVITIDEAGSDLSRLIARVEAGEEILLARGDAPVAKLVAYTPPLKPRRRPGALKGVRGQYFLELPIASHHGHRAGLLDGPHRDPFDRMLIAQALART